MSIAAALAKASNLPLNPALTKLFESKTDGNIIEVPLSKLYQGFDVRDIGAQSPDRIDHFEALFSDKTKVLAIPPILVEEIKGRYLIVEGRNRFEGAKKAKFKTVPVIVFTDLIKNEQIVLAMAGNSNGAMPHTKRELRDNVYKMLENGWQAQEIRLALSYIPKGMLEKAMRHAGRDYTDVQVEKAIVEVKKENKPDFQLIAQKFGVSTKQIKGSIGAKARWAKSDPTKMSGNIGSTCLAHRQFLSRTTASLFRQLNEGDLETDFVNEMLTKLKKHVTELQGHLKIVDSKFKNQQWGS